MITLTRLRTKNGPFRAKLLASQQKPVQVTYSLFSSVTRVQLVDLKGELIEVEMTNDLIRDLHKRLV